MSLNKKFQQIEKNINISKLFFKKQNMWPLLRIEVGITIWNDSFLDKFLKTKKNSVFLRKIKLIILGFLLTIINIKKYKYIFFTDSDDYKKINNIYHNRLTHEMQIFLKDEHGLEIQSGSGFHRNKEVANITCIPATFILLAIKIAKQFIILKKNDFEHISVELKRLGINNLSVKMVIKNYIVLKAFYGLLFKITKPKLIVSTCYNNLIAIQVANSMGIRTLEIQHGNVLSGSYAYKIEKKNLSEKYYPTYMATTGLADKNYLSRAGYIRNVNNIFNVGNSMVSLFSNKNNKTISALSLKYKKIFAVTLQVGLKDVLLDYIVSQAKKNPTFIFIIIFRDNTNKLSLETPENIVSYPGMHFYEIIAHVNYHITISSTTAREAPSFGVKNIFYNYDNMSIIHFKRYIFSKKFNFILEHEQDIKNVIANDKKIGRRTIIKDNEEYNTPCYSKNIKKMIEKVCR